MGRLAASLILLLLGACASDPPPGRPAPGAAFTGSVVASVIGTPIYAVTKATTCVAGALIGGASSAAVELTDRPDRDLERAALHEGIGRNCRGPYYLPGAY